MTNAASTPRGRQKKGEKKAIIISTINCRIKGASQNAGKVQKGEKPGGFFSCREERNNWKPSQS